jgi:hypothetical protein
MHPHRRVCQLELTISQLLFSIIVQIVDPLVPFELDEVGDVGCPAQQLLMWYSYNMKTEMFLAVALILLL